MKTWTFARWSLLPALSLSALVSCGGEDLETAAAEAPLITGSSGCTVYVDLANGSLGEFATTGCSEVTAIVIPHPTLERRMRVRWYPGDWTTSSSGKPNMIGSDLDANGAEYCDGSYVYSRREVTYRRVGAASWVYDWIDDANAYARAEGEVYATGGFQAGFPTRACYEPVDYRTVPTGLSYGHETSDGPLYRFERLVKFTLKARKAKVGSSEAHGFRVSFLE